MHGRRRLRSRGNRSYWRRSRGCLRRGFRYLFENGAAAFQSKERPACRVEEEQKRIEFLGKKVQTKDEVLAELMAEDIAFRKNLGEL